MDKTGWVDGFAIFRSREPGWHPWRLVRVHSERHPLRTLPKLDQKFTEIDRFLNSWCGNSQSFSEKLEAPFAPAEV
jgi:hypothetical protein